LVGKLLKRDEYFMNKKRYLVTAALPYANGPLHIGHLAGAYLTADIYVKYLKAKGEDVVFVCGSDEHGAAITIRAKKEGITPQEIIDKYDAMFRKTFDGIGIEFDIFHRTSSPLHHETSQAFFKQLYDNGVFSEQESEQYYDESANQFLADRYIIGVCPKCANPDAYGDQCERCGSTLSPMELLAPIRSSLSDASPIIKKTSHWYLPLDKYENWLKEWIDTGIYNGTKLHEPKEWKNHVLGQCKSWLEGGLQPRAMTRDLEWGVDVPQEIPNSKGKKLYVWLDAPIGYISATKQWAKDNGKNWEDYWKKEDSTLIHFIGKDNIVFHCIIFPAILKAHGGYILPTNVPANQFMNLEGNKISTSRNWAVWVHEYLEEIEGKQDELRYNLIKNMPEQRDSEFTWKNFQETTDTELVNNLANFVNRVFVLVNKFFEGNVPDLDETVFLSGITNESTSFQLELKNINALVEKVNQSIESFDFRNALQAVMEISSAGNLLLQNNEPWKTAKTDLLKTGIVLNIGLQYIATLSIVCRPFLPFVAVKLQDMLHFQPENNSWLFLQNQLAEGKPLVASGTISEPIHIFSRIPDEIIEAQIAKLKQSEMENITTSEKNYEPIKAEINYDDFAKMDIRIGTILEAKKVEKADKLLELKVDLGFETRTIVSGIAEHFAPESIIGLKVQVLANLAPRKLRGIESQGMILLAQNSEGKLVFVSPADDCDAGRTVN
jgi:methionyl-tRNA synthetase